MSGHYIAWTIGSFGLDVTIECREPAEADCRTECSGECEYWLRSAANPALCANCGRALRTGQECNALLFMDDEYIDSYDGPDNEPVRDGLVEVDWHGEGDGYTWHYPEPDAVQLRFDTTEASNG